MHGYSIEVYEEAFETLFINDSFLDCDRRATAERMDADQHWAVDRDEGDEELI